MILSQPQAQYYVAQQQNVLRWFTTSNINFTWQYASWKSDESSSLYPLFSATCWQRSWQIISTRYKAHSLMWWQSLIIPSDISNRVSVRRQPFKVVSSELEKKACCPELSWSRISKCVGFSPRYQFHSTHVLALKLATGWHLIAAQYYNSLS